MLRKILLDNRLTKWFLGVIDSRITLLLNLLFTFVVIAIWITITVIIAFPILMAIELQPKILQSSPIIWIGIIVGGAAIIFFAFIGIFAISKTWIIFFRPSPIILGIEDFHEELNALDLPIEMKDEIIKEAEKRLPQLSSALIEAKPRLMYLDSFEVAGGKVTIIRRSKKIVQKDK